MTCYSSRNLWLLTEWNKTKVIEVFRCVVLQSEDGGRQAWMKVELGVVVRSEDSFYENRKASVRVPGGDVHVHCFMCRGGWAHLRVTSFWQDDGLYKTCGLPGPAYARRSSLRNGGTSPPLVLWLRIRRLLSPVFFYVFVVWVTVSPKHLGSLFPRFTCRGCNSILICCADYLAPRCRCIGYVTANSIWKDFWGVGGMCELVVIWVCFKVSLCPCLSGKRGDTRDSG